VKDTTSILGDLHETYAERINLAIEENRDDLVEALADEFTDVALMAIVTLENG
jgi:hypothetical protein